MTAQQETRFRCDRCGDEHNEPHANTPAARTLTAPPSWATLWLDDNTRAPTHLCPECKLLFEVFMARED